MCMCICVHLSASAHARLGVDVGLNPSPAIFFSANYAFDSHLISKTNQQLQPTQAFEYL